WGVGEAFDGQLDAPTGDDVHALLCDLLGEAADEAALAHAALAAEEDRRGGALAGAFGRVDQGLEFRLTSHEARADRPGNHVVQPATPVIGGSPHFLGA